MRRSILLVAAVWVGAFLALPQQPPAMIQQMIVPQVDAFRVPSQTYELTSIPATAQALVYVNGLLMLAGEDYTITGTTLTFTKQPVAKMTTPIIQVLYWRAAK